MPDPIKDDPRKPKEKAPAPKPPVKPSTSTTKKK